MPPAGPFHVLMNQTRPLTEMLVRDDSVRTDYLARRFQNINGNKVQKDLWSAASPLERALVECCEVASQDEDDSDGVTLRARGALTQGKEGAFVRLLAMHCHTAAPRALALAILERTIEQDEFEREDDEDDMDDDDSRDDTNSIETVQEASEGNAEKMLEAKDAKGYPQQVEKDDQRNSKVDDVTDGGGMGRFLSAGGLKILNQWLLDAMTPAKTDIPRSQSLQSSGTASDKRMERVVQTSASPTGPLLLLLLAVLRDMPFDNNLVKRVKINKQIRNLKKQLDEVASPKQLKKSEEAKWSDPLSGGLPVAEVKAAVSSLMKKWLEAQEKSKPFVAEDPFEALQVRMSERLEELTKFEAGELEKPDWLVQFEEKERNAKEEAELSKMTTEQRAVRERLREKERLFEIERECFKEAKAKREQLLKRKREESSKRKAENNADNPNRKRPRRISWKDGFDNSDNLKRNILEEVFIYPSESSWDGEDEEAEPAGGHVEQEEGIVEEEPDDANDDEDIDLFAEDVKSDGEG